MFVRTQNSRWLERPWFSEPAAFAVTPLDVLQSELGHVLFNSRHRADAGYCHARQPAPDVALVDAGSHLKLSVHLAGLSEKDIQLQLTADHLVLRGERKVAVPDGYQVRRRERKSFTFERSYRIPQKIEPDQAEASLVNGVLNVVLPKAEAARPRNIAVRTS